MLDFGRPCRPVGMDDQPGPDRPVSAGRLRLQSMTTMSIRISNEPVYQRLKAGASSRRQAISTLAERLIDEGLRMDAHPAVVFRDGPTGRRAALAGGPELADVVGAIIGGDVPVEERRARAADLMAISLAMVDAAVAYYTDYTAEIDAEIAQRKQAAEAAEAAWTRERVLLETGGCCSMKCTHRPSQSHSANGA